MAGLQIPCPKCGKTLKLPDRSLLGRKGKCPKCRHAFVMTEPGEKEIRGIGFRTDPSLNAVQVLQVQRARGGSVRIPDDN